MADDATSVTNSALADKLERSLGGVLEPNAYLSRGAFLTAEEWRIVLNSLRSAVGMGKPVAWRYRYHHATLWKYADTEEECNHGPQYEHEPLYTAPVSPERFNDAAPALPGSEPTSAKEPLDVPFEVGPAAASPISSNGGAFITVPRDPTPAMSAAGFAVSEAEHDPAGVYRAMIAAAPSAPPSSEPLGRTLGLVEARKIIARCHEAIGEDPGSDDETLPDSIALIVREGKERIAALERELAEEHQRANNAHQDWVLAYERARKAEAALSSAIAPTKARDTLGHAIRSSDSSLYDERCANCGATDAAGDDRLKRQCPAGGAMDSTASKDA